MNNENKGIHATGVSSRVWAMLVVVCAINVVAHLMVMPSLPAQIPTHWGANGAVDGWGPSWMASALGVLPLALLAMFCMVPRIDVEAVELSTSVEELTRRFVESKYSRIFVWEGSIDNIVGYVNSKSLFRQPADLRKVLMTAYFVPETMPLQALLEHFIKHRSYIAVVIDEFGGTAGIISLEDVLEQIFGEIEDEHDEQDMIEKQVDENEYVFSCRLEVKYLNERYGLGIEESREYDTLAGYIISHLDGIPSAGQSLTVDGLEIRVLRTTRSRIELARVRRL